MNHLGVATATPTRLGGGDEAAGPGHLDGLERTELGR